MKCCFDSLYSKTEDSLRLFECLYMVSENQGTTFILRLGDTSEYVFPRGMERELRTKKFKEVIEKHKPP